MTQKTKICVKCKKELPATTEYFYYCGKHKDGLRYQCKDCQREYKRSRRREIAKNTKIYKKKTQQENRENYNHYQNIHNKIKRLKSGQIYCSICNQEKNLELSSIDGKYSEDVNDYWWLCHDCHGLYDRINKTHKIKK